eukprot:Gb_23166 [translate_table: standard]
MSKSLHLGSQFFPYLVQGSIRQPGCIWFSPSQGAPDPCQVNPLPGQSISSLTRSGKSMMTQEDKVVSIDEALIDHVIGLPIHGDKIDLREEARIMARRLIGVEVSTYLSHQWATIAAKVTKGTIYAWAPWVANKLKEYCLASQMFGCPFPMPSLVVVICIDALGPLGWINPDDQPQLNSYSRLKGRRGDTKDKAANAYLGRFYLMLWRLNDGREKSKKFPKYIKMQWRDEIGELRTLPSIEQATMATKVLPGFCPHVHLLRKSALAAKEAPPIPPEALLEREACLGGHMKNMQLVERGRSLVNRVEVTLGDTLPFISSFQSNIQGLIPPICSLKLLPQEMSQIKLSMDHLVKEHPLPVASQILLDPPITETSERTSEAPPIEDQPRLQSDISLHTRDQIIEPSREGETSTTDKELGAATPFEKDQGILANITNQPEGQPLGSSGRELETKRVFTTLHLPDILEVGSSHATGPDLSEPHLLLQALGDLPPSGTSDVEPFEFVSSIA